MNIVFYILVILGILFLLAVVSPLFAKLGQFAINVFKGIRNNIGLSERKEENNE